VQACNVGRLKRFTQTCKMMQATEAKGSRAKGTGSAVKGLVAGGASPYTSLLKANSVAGVGERPPFVGEVSANFSV
jgi:hypothetical protein